MARSSSIKAKKRKPGIANPEVKMHIFANVYSGIPE
jgi:hypothetical protein